MNINDILSNISQSLEVYAYARYSTDMQSNNSTAKSPMGAFESLEIENNMADVLKALEEFQEEN